MIISLHKKSFIFHQYFQRIFQFLCYIKKEAKYYQKDKKMLQKTHVKTIKIFRKKKKNVHVLVIYTENSLSRRT